MVHRRCMEAWLWYECGMCVCVRGGVLRGVCYAEDASNDDYEPVMLRDGGSIKKREERGRGRRGIRKTRV